MADEQTPQQQTTATTPAQPVTVGDAVSANASAIVTEVDNSIKGLWSRYKILFIFVAALLLIAKFSDLIMDLLGWSSKKDVEKAQKTDAQLKAQEDAANQQANDLIKKANDLPNHEGPVDENWDKKK